MTGFHSVVRHGEAASTNNKAADKFVSEFQDYLESEASIPHQVFNWVSPNSLEKEYQIEPTS